MNPPELEEKYRLLQGRLKVRAQTLPLLKSVLQSTEWTIDADLEQGRKSEPDTIKKGVVLKTIVDNFDIVKPYLVDYSDNCALPLVSKYALYAYMDKPPDDIVDDLYNEAYGVAKLVEDNKVIHDFLEGCKQPPEMTGYDRVDTIRKTAWALCEVVNHPAENRLDKVVAIEKVVNARHNSGPFFEHLCSHSHVEANSLISTVLDMLAGE